MRRTLLGSTMVKYRKAKGLTQRELARETGLSSGYIAHIETGYSSPSPEVKKALSKVIGMSIETMKELENSNTDGVLSDLYEHWIIQRPLRFRVEDLNSLMKNDSICTIMRQAFNASLGREEK